MQRINKKSLKEKIWNKFSDSIIGLARHLPKAKKGTLSWLQHIGLRNEAYSNEMPNDLNLKLFSILVGVVIPIEDFHKSINGIIQLWERYFGSSKKFKNNIPDRRRLEKELNDIENERYTYSSCNIGMLDFSKSDLRKTVEYAYFEIWSSPGDYVVLIFRARPTQSFLDKINGYVSSDFPNHVVLVPPKKLTRFFKGEWMATTTYGFNCKSEIIKDEIYKFKNAFTREIKNFLPRFPFNDDATIPSIEIWTFEKTKQSSVVNGNMRQNYFWQSVGIIHGCVEPFETDDKKYLLFWPISETGDLSLKILVDVPFVSENGNSHCLGCVNDDIYDLSKWALSLLPVLSFMLILNDLTSNLREIKVKVFATLKGNSLESHRVLFEKLLNYQIILKRLLKYFEKGICEHLLGHLPTMAGINPIQENKRKHFIDYLRSRRKLMINDAAEVVDICQKSLETSLSYLEVRSNWVTQRAVCIFSFVMLMISIVDLLPDWIKHKICTNWMSFKKILSCITGLDI